MDAAGLEWLVPKLTVVYFAPDAQILTPGAGVPEFLYIIKQGGVLGFDREHTAAVPNWRLSAGECFPLGALMGERPVTSVYRAAGDTFCYRLQAMHFRDLLARSPEFTDFATRRLSSLLAQSRRAMLVDRVMGEHVPPLAGPIADIVLQRAPVTCEPKTILRDALDKMRRERADYVLVTHADGSAAGIFTLRDLRDRVALTGGDVTGPIEDVMTPAPLTLSVNALAVEAAVTMARHGIHHIVITDRGRAVGILSESDLFALQRIGLTAVSAGLRAARSPQELVTLGKDVLMLAHDLLRQGVPTHQLTHILSALNDCTATRLIELEANDLGITADEFCWLALGSEGRQEQTLATDQDNGIIFPDPVDGDVHRVRDRLLPFASRVNEGLAACGFPLCRGDIMARNPRWCLSLSEWKNTFAAWMQTPDGEALLRAAIFFDFRALSGALGLADELRNWLAANAAGRDVFLRFMAENALRNEPPLGLLRDFAVSDHEGNLDTLDLKVNGAALFIDAARILALACGSKETNTERRLRGAAAARSFPESDVGAWIDAFNYLQGIRLTHQQEQLERGAPGDNYISPEGLNALDRRILKESFRQARKLQQRLRLDYRLGA